MGMRYLADSNVLIDYIAGIIVPVEGLVLLDEVFDLQLNVSVVTRIEVLGFKGDEKKMDMMNGLLSLATIFHTNDKITEKAIEIRKKHKIKLPDAIIAATAIVNELVLITHNVSDFGNIKGLKILDPWNLKQH